MSDSVNFGISPTYDGINPYEMFEIIKNELSGDVDGSIRHNTFKQAFEILFGVSIDMIDTIEEDIDTDEALQLHDFIKSSFIDIFNDEFGIMFSEENPLIDLNMLYQTYRFLDVNFPNTVANYIIGSTLAEEIDLEGFRTPNSVEYKDFDKTFIDPFINDEFNFEGLRFFNRILLINVGDVDITRLHDMIESFDVVINNPKFRTRLAREVNSCPETRLYITKLVKIGLNLR